MTLGTPNNMDTTAISWSAVRQDFPILDQQVNGHPLIYFDNAASSQKPRAVIDALSRFYLTDNANVHRGLHELSARSTDAYEKARSTVASFLGAASDEEILFVRGTTEAVNLVASAWGGKSLQAGDVILLTEMEHHSNLVPWQLLAERTGAVVRYVPVLEDGTLDLDAAEKLLAPPVKIFSFVHISNSLGTINPAAQLCRWARERGIATFVDGAQSAGHLPVNVQELGCDFYGFSGHKVCAPTGIGALYGRLGALNALPPWQGGGEMIETVRYDRTTFKSAPHRFEAGTPDFAGAIALGAALQYLEKIGRERIFTHDLALTQLARRLLEEIPGVRVLGPEGERGALTSFVMEAAHPHDLVTYANEYGLALRGGHHCTQPLMRKLRLPGTARASFYFYNTEEEVHRMAQILTAAQRYFS